VTPRAMVVVDGNNVMGSRPDGWWRDRSGAVRRLLARLQCYAATIPEALTLVLDVAQPDLPEGDQGGVRVTYARRSGPNAGDDRVIEILRDLDGNDTGAVRVITSDRALAEEARRLGAAVTGAGAFLTKLDTAGC
jgi:predicted RNA-binding protein with PIN domain